MIWLLLRWMLLAFAGGSGTAGVFVFSGLFIETYVVVERVITCDWLRMARFDCLT